MKPEKHRLIQDLLADPTEPMRREATLLTGRRLLRHRRWRCVAARGFGVVLAITMVGISVYRWTAPQGRSPVTAAGPKTPVNYLTDDQMLALFPDTPVGLATVGDKKVLIFPRPGDQERFVGRF